MKHTHAERLDRMIRYGITDPERCDMAHAVLCRLDASVMTQEDVARRWPRIVALMIQESLGYFTPRSAANALLAHKLKRAFGCEYYCFSAGFETDGWPKEREEYDRKLREVNERKIRSSVSCRQYEGNYDQCAAVVAGEVEGTLSICGEYRYSHSRNPHHPFTMPPTNHHGCRHSKIQDTGMMSNYSYALQLVRDMAGGAANPPALLASWF